MLPTVPPANLDLLRPDILLIDGLTQSDLASLAKSSLSPSDMHALQQRCLVHIVELTYTSEICRSNSLTQKSTQHSRLISLLLHAGWKLHSTTPNSRRPPPFQTHHISPSFPHLPVPPTTQQSPDPRIALDLIRMSHSVAMENLQMISITK